MESFNLRIQRAMSVSVFISIILIAMAQTCFASPDSTSAAESKPYILGVFPHLSSGQIEKLFAPLAAHMSQELGRPVRLRTKPNFTDFTAELSRKTYDVAFVQPLDYVIAHDKYGYVPLARRAGELSAELVVLPDSPLRNIDDLKGKKIGLPPKIAAISYLTRKALRDAGLDIHKDIKLEYFKAHDACLNQLILRRVDVCGSAEHPIRFFENKWKIVFRKIAITKSMPPALFMAQSRIPREQRDAIRRSILSWQKTKQGRDMLQGNGFTLFQAAKEKEYEVVRKLIKE